MGCARSWGGFGRVQSVWFLDPMQKPRLGVARRRQVGQEVPVLHQGLLGVGEVVLGLWRVSGRARGRPSRGALSVPRADASVATVFFIRDMSCV